MSRDQIRLFIDSIIPVVLEAGELAINFQQGIANIEKEIDTDNSESERIKARDRAKTEIDDKVQELILSAIKEILGTQNIKIDAEEDTPTKKEFENLKSSITVVIDPIDGTLEYVNGSEKYSINVGLIENGKILTSIVYFPKSKKLYFLGVENIPLLITYSENLQIIDKKELLMPTENNQKKIYTNNRVPKEIINKLINNGYSVIEDTGEILWPDALIKCISGEYRASIFHSPQIRDVLLGALIERLSNGFMIDWKGNKCRWPNGGRIPEVIFGTGNLPVEIINNLNN